MALTGEETIGALAETAMGLAVRCRGCRRLTCFPFRLMRERHGVRPELRVADLARRLVCEACRMRVQDLACLAPWNTLDGQPGRRLGPPA